MFGLFYTYYLSCEGHCFSKMLSFKMIKVNKFTVNEHKIFYVAFNCDGFL